MPDQKTCRCNCGYTCGRQCGLPIMECIKQHYVQDCEHDFNGPVIEDDDGLGASVVCSKCGLPFMAHDMARGA